jgi:hypothetical protein
LKIIKGYTHCSDELQKRNFDRFGAPVVLVSILKKIFGNFSKGTKQIHQYLKTWGNTPLHTAAGNGHMAAYHLIMENLKIQIQWGKI